MSGVFVFGPNISGPPGAPGAPGAVEKLTGANFPQSLVFSPGYDPGISAITGYTAADLTPGNTLHVTGWQSTDVPGTTLPAIPGALTLNTGGNDHAVIFVGVA